MKITRFLSLIFLLISTYAYSESREFSYFEDYEFETLITKVKHFDGYTKTNYRGKFILKPNASEPDKLFRDITFVLYTRDVAVPGVIPQLTIVLPNLSPVKSIDKKIARGLSQRGSDVLLLKTGITWWTYARELKDFNHILRHQMLSAHHALNFTLETLSTPPDRIQTIGASLGAILSMAMLSLDDRITHGISFIGGAGYKGSIELGLVAKVTRFLQRRSDEPSPGIIFDAADIPEGFQDKKALIYRSTKDAFIPFARQGELQEILDDPEVRWLRRGHVYNVLTSHHRVDEYFQFFNQGEQ